MPCAAMGAGTPDGAPVMDGVLPALLEKMCCKLGSSDRGDRHMVKILSAVLSDGPRAVEAACIQALA